MVPRIGASSIAERSKPIGMRTRKRVLVLFLLGAMLPATREARASTGTSFLETIGVSIAMGTVLGASTLPFYNQPKDHLGNLAIGAGIGAVVGLGLGLYGKLSGASHSDPAEAGVSSGVRQEDFRGNFSVANVSDSARLAGYVPHVAIFWTPVVSLTW